MAKEINVAHVIVNNLGGITSLIQNLIIYKDVDALPQELHILNIKGDEKTTAFIDNRLHETLQIFNLYPKDNWYHVYRELSYQLNKNKGILISNDQYDLVMLKAFNIDRKVVQIVHDEYNLSLSVKFEKCIDKFIAHSVYIYNQLIESIPNRKSDIVLIRYGIPIQDSQIIKNSTQSNLNLLFLGRHSKAKGIYDIFEINNIIEEKGFKVFWTILGKGPETENVKAQWSGKENVTFKTPENNDEVMLEISKNDILVFPTKFEGFPVAILESMSRGCVPISSNIAGGIQEVVFDGITGYKCTMDDNNEFASRIETLHKDRILLKKMQEESKKLVANEFEVQNQSKKFQDFFKVVANEGSKPRHHQINEKIGSRLDQKWIPNFITYTIRKYISNKN
jgi:glycosyltransferase involved in cell wall biosynthesis